MQLILLHGDHRNTGPASKQGAAGWGTHRGRVTSVSTGNVTAQHVKCVVVSPPPNWTSWIPHADRWMTVILIMRGCRRLAFPHCVSEALHFNPWKSGALSNQHTNKTMPHHRHLKQVPARSIYPSTDAVQQHSTINYLNNHDSHTFHYVFNSTNKSQ